MSLVISIGHLTFYPTGLELLLMANVAILVILVAKLIASQHRSLRFAAEEVADLTWDAAIAEDARRHLRPLSNPNPIRVAAGETRFHAGVPAHVRARIIRQRGGK